MLFPPQVGVLWLFISQSGLYENGGQSPSLCIIPPPADCQTRMYVSYRIHTNVSYHQTLRYLSYNQTSATARTIALHAAGRRRRDIHPLSMQNDG